MVTLQVKESSVSETTKGYVLYREEKESVPICIHKNHLSWREEHYTWW